MSSSKRVETVEVMKTIAQALDETLNGQQRPKKNCFVVLIFPFDGEAGNRINYVSNADRSDIVAALKEITARFEGQSLQSGRA
ncbi:hypothetical protein [Ensifer sp. LCM 4579]|uniref:hypothetical protein n=1 Tax=Ensifer sp. LCM 4579 TaxID=1848292 RepID=UPI0008D99F7B|nr:hypothetical protein [Ensifer sp. LCM 4579]OHV85921.1 hypothetical protein LCM4579_00740 [Ensifer sp. LCM 4579]